MTTREEVAKKLNLTHVTTEQFWKVCPIPMAELLSKNNKQEIVVWRNLGMLVFWLNGCTTSHAGKQFNKDHSVMIYARKTILEAKNSRHTMQLKAIKMLNEGMHHVSDLKEVQGLATLEHKIKWL